VKKGRRRRRPRWRLLAAMIDPERKERAIVLTSLSLVGGSYEVLKSRP
jgi:hypothetical protein